MSRRSLREVGNAVHQVVLTRIDVPVHRVNIHTGVEHQTGLITLNDSLWFRTPRVCRRVREPVEYPDGPKVEILKKYFSGPDIERNGAIAGIRIPEPADRFSLQFDWLCVLRRRGI